MSKILIVEDEEDIAKVLRKRLEEYNFEVICAVDAYYGVSLAHKEMPDLIILDLMLPAGGGFVTLTNLKVSQHTQRIPVLVLTGSQDEELKRKVLNIGVDAYMQKPYEISELVGTINSILQHKEEQS